jgi:penicillin-binding protein 2
MKRLPLSLLVFALLFTACGLLPGGSDSPGVGPAVGEQPESAAPDLSEPDGVVQTFLNAWMAGDYEGMYSLLSPNSQAEYSLEQFVDIYTSTATTMTQFQNGGVEASPQSVLETGTTAQVAFHVVYHTQVLGDIEQDLEMQLVFGDRWGIAWTPALIFPELAGGNILQLEVETPARANIYDRNGLWMVSANASALTLQIVPGEISTAFEDQMLEFLSELLRMSVADIRQNYEGLPDDWLISLGDVDLETFNEVRNIYFSYPGLYVSEKTGRRYFNLLAPHVLGYTGFIPAEQLDAYKAQGYQGDEIVGLSGLEQWGEDYLSGTPGGVLSAYTSGGQYFGAVAQRDPQPSQSIYSTLDRDLQIIVQDAIEDAYRASQDTWAPTAGGAAVVVVDVNSGDILAMASYPYFDPNVLHPYNDHPLRTDTYLTDMFSDPLRPLLNRATQGQYPPGSIFKIVSISTALGSGLFDANSLYTCTGTWTELGTNNVRYDWLEGGHGTLTLPQGLTASCNPWFYHIGLTTGREDFNLLPRYAREFGLGSEMNIEIAEEPGLIPDPDWLQQTEGAQWDVSDSVNMAIGQGAVLTTPLQIAMMVATIANGGTLYQPHLVDRVGLIGEDPSLVVEPTVLHRLSLSEEDINTIRESMRNVAIDPNIGTAQWRLGSLQIPVAGKTGTAQVSTPGAPPNAWFGGFVPYDDPEIAIAVVVENGGQGSSVAAPIFRRIVEKYYGLSVLPYPDDWGDPELFDFVSDEIGE